MAIASMTERETYQQFEQVVRKLDPRCRLLRVRDLRGGVSARVTALAIAWPDGQTKTVIARRYGDAVLQRNPDVAAHEFKLLQRVRSVGLPAPMPYLVDQSGEIFSRPYVVIEHIDGEPEFAPSDLAGFLARLAAQLARIHSLDCSTLDLWFLPRLEDAGLPRLRERSSTAGDWLDTGSIRRTLRSVWPLPQRNRTSLLHGDFWPGNLLWRDGALVAIIDWEDAKLGDPLADLANSRLEILWAFGMHAMHRFAAQYRTLTTIDFTDLPYWDLYAALGPASKLSDWGLDVSREQTMREGLRIFAAQAFDHLPIR